MTWADKMREAPPESLYQFVTTLGRLVDDRCALVEQQVEQFRDLLNGTPADIEFVRHAPPLACARSVGQVFGDTVVLAFGKAR